MNRIKFGDPAALRTKAGGLNLAAVQHGAVWVDRWVTHLRSRLMAIIASGVRVRCSRGQHESVYHHLQQPKGYRASPAGISQSCEAAFAPLTAFGLRGVMLRYWRRLSALTIRLPVLLGIVEHHQRCEFRRSGGIPCHDGNGGEAGRDHPAEIGPALAQSAFRRQIEGDSLPHRLGWVNGAR